jgi:phosphate transport system permease protein
MTTFAPSRVDGGVPADLRRSAVSRRRRLTDSIVKGVIWATVLVAVIPLGLVTYYVVARGAQVMNFTFLTDRIAIQPTSTRGGMGPAIIGTLLTTGVAALIAIPLGVLGAIYLNEYGKQKLLARTIRTMADVMTGVPSIVMGLFIFLTWVLLTDGKTLFAGALALGCLMLPVVIRSTEEMLKLVPDDLRQASLALGARKWRTTVTVVLPAAISGIMSGALLAIARAAGETAPIVLVVGLTYRVRWNLFAEGTSLPAQIYSNASQPYDAAVNRGWGAALTLVAIVLIMTLIGRFIAARYAIKPR